MLSWRLLPLSDNLQFEAELNEVNVYGTTRIDEAAATTGTEKVALDKPAHLTIRVLWVLVSDCETSAVTL